MAFLQDKMDALKNSLDFSIQNTIPDGSKVAIVTFKDTSTIEQDLIIVTQQTRQDLRRIVRGLQADGLTCIGCGLQSAIEV